MKPQKPLSYPVTTAILANMDPLKRMELDSGVPHLKRIPFCLNFVEFNAHTGELRVNEHSFQVSQRGTVCSITSSDGMSYRFLRSNVPFASLLEGLAHLEKVFFSGRNLVVKTFHLRGGLNVKPNSFEIKELETDTDHAASLPANTMVDTLKLAVHEPSALELQVVINAKVLIITDLNWRLSSNPPDVNNPVVVLRDMDGSVEKLAYYVMKWSGDHRTSGIFFMKTRNSEHTRRILVELSQRQQCIVHQRPDPQQLVVQIPIFRTHQVIVTGCKHTIRHADVDFIYDFIRMEAMSKMEEFGKKLDQKCPFCHSKFF